MNTSDCIAAEEKLGAHNYHPLDVVIEKGSGVWVWDVDGNKYMDFLAAYSALNQGHCHPRLVKVMQEQASKLTLTSRAFRNDKLPLFYKECNKLTGYEAVLPMNSGAEAVETAIKVVRKWGYDIKKVKPGKAKIIISANNFHGRTITIISFSTEPLYKEGFGPFTEGFEVIPFGDIKALEKAMDENTVAFMTEPIQGEAGIIIPPDGFLKQAQDLCRKNNALFILDEIQSGLGRTGKLFAYQHEEGVKPDGIIAGKALSGGFYPVSAFMTSREIMDVIKPGSHGSTFGGSPLAAAVATEALKIIAEEDLPGNSDKMGKYLLENLRKMKIKNLKELRGKGLWIGLELNESVRSKAELLKEKGILCKETHITTLRFAPPLVITKDEIDWSLERMSSVLEQ
ncbi:ornithine--oxo-acid transaminase [candidate division WOR-3 bacterium]|nr:ornithine--oxo-acid transaminase [candidate division WOR-3 bacterium]